MGRILIIDPSLLDRKRMAIVLEAAGHEVQEAASPAEAQSGALAEAAPVDLILTAVQGMDEAGASFLAWLKGSPRWQWTPVIVVTPPSSRETVIQLVAAGAETVVAKPFTPELLLRRVTQALAERGFLVPQGAIRSDLSDQLRRELKRAERSGSSLSLLVLKLPHSLDRTEWDDLLSAIGRTLRGSDLVAQVGRDAAAVLLPEAGPEGAAAVAVRLRTLVAEKAAGSPLPSTGTATYPIDSREGAELLKLALDRASAAAGLPNVRQ